MQDGSLTIQIQAEPIKEAKCAQCGQLLDLQDIKPLSKVICPTCGAEKTVPGRFANYLILELLGTGGMGAVYRGLDQILDRPVALKVLLKSMRDKPELRDRFRREAKAAASINHPNVSHIYAFGEEDGQPYIVMEYVAGKSLDKIMEAEGKLDPAFIVNTGIQVAEGLQAGAKSGLVHGDVKPENILYDSEYTAKLIDFGLASLVDEEVKGGVWGSPYYLSPERVQRQPTDARSDMYSLGCTLYHALAGRPPFDGESAIEVLKARLERPAKPLGLVRKDIPSGVTRAVARMLSLDISKRYPNYPSLIADLQSVAKEMDKIRYPTARFVKRTGRHAEAPARHTTQPRRTADQSAAALKRTTGHLGRVRTEGGGAGRWVAGLLILGLAAAGGLYLVNAGRRSPASGVAQPDPALPNPGSAPTVRGLVHFETGRLLGCRGYGGTGSAEVTDGGRTLNLKGSIWVAYPAPLAVVTPGTVLEFDFASRKAGALQGIAVAPDNGARPDRLFKLHGTRNAGIRGFDYGPSAPNFKHYVIPVGQHYTGKALFLLFANDDNSNAQNAESTYANVRLYNR